MNQNSVDRIVDSAVRHLGEWRSGRDGHSYGKVWAVTVMFFLLLLLLLSAFARTAATLGS